MGRMKVLAAASAVIGLLASTPGLAQGPTANGPPRTYGQPAYGQPSYGQPAPSDPYGYPPQPAYGQQPGYPQPAYGPRPTPGGPYMPSLIAPDANHDQIVGWLARNVPASRGRTVYINGDEAFWIEHQDPDPRNDMKLEATIHTESFAGQSRQWRSSYEVTEFDCEYQQQAHVYVSRYPGTGLTGEASKESPMIRHGEFVSPTSLDFGHLRAACLTIYDQIRRRLYQVQVPAR